MPTSRALKRPTDGGDSPIESPSGPKMKLARLDRGPEDFSSVVKSKLQSYTRTGQACDRCKVCSAPSPNCAAVASSSHLVHGAPTYSTCGLLLRCERFDAMLFPKDAPTA
jgi:hypothetical protein